MTSFFSKYCLRCALMYWYFLLVFLPLNICSPSPLWLLVLLPIPQCEVCQNSVLGLLFFSIRFPLVTDGTPIASDTVSVLFDLNPNLCPYLPVLWTGHLHSGVALGISHCLCQAELMDHLSILLEVFSYTSVICVVTQTSYVGAELEFFLSLSLCSSPLLLESYTLVPNPLHPCSVHVNLKLLLFVYLFFYSFNRP